jgi:tripartite-type tricarboxylate transporter receptor subunit TctC
VRRVSRAPHTRADSVSCRLHGRPAFGIAVLLAVLGGPFAVAQAEWPERPITVVVMYAAGGGTDTVLRALVAEMARVKGWRINVVNRPGAAGALATRYVLNRPADGYTLLGASNFNKYSRIVGGSESKPWADWYYLQAAMGVASWAVRPDSRFKTFDDAIRAARAAPGTITISTSGAGGQWHEWAAVIARATGVTLRYVPYASGQLATLAGLNGEVDIAGGGIHEHAQFIDAGQLVSLQQSSASDITTPGGRSMPSIKAMVPALEAQLPLGGPYNLGVRRDTPIEILREIHAAFVTAAQSETFARVAADHHLVVDVLVGAAADRRAAELETISAELFQVLEIPGARPPALLELPLPDRFAEWWPPTGYAPLPL